MTKEELNEYVNDFMSDLLPATTTAERILVVALTKHLMSKFDEQIGCTNHKPDMICPRCPINLGQKHPPSQPREKIEQLRYYYVVDSSGKKVANCPDQDEVFEKINEVIKVLNSLIGK